MDDIDRQNPDGIAEDAGANHFEPDKSPNPGSSTNRELSRKNTASVDRDYVPSSRTKRQRQSRLLSDSK